MKNNANEDNVDWLSPIPRTVRLVNLQHHSDRTIDDRMGGGAVSIARCLQTTELQTTEAII